MSQTVLEVAIIGAGPAGMSAAIYLGRAGHRVSIFEQLAPGGQAALTHSIDNYPGFPEGISGWDLAEKIKLQAERFGAEFIYDSVVSCIKNTETNYFHITSGVGNEYIAKAVLITTGATAKRLLIPGEDKFFGRGIGTCAVCDGAFYKDKVVAVIGGGNSAVEESLYLANIVEKVYIIHRRDSLRAEKITQDNAIANPKIEFIWDTVVEEFQGTQKLEQLKLKNVKTNEITEMPIDGVFLYVGLQAQTSFLSSEYCDAQGFIKIDQWNTVLDCQGLFAAGDCCFGTHKQVAIAVAEGIKASFSILNYLD